MANNPLGKNLLTTKEVAEHFAVDSETVLRWRKRDLLVGIAVGRGWRFEPDEIEKLKTKLRTLKKQ